MRTELTSPVADVPTHTRAAVQVSKPRLPSQAREEKTPALQQNKPPQPVAPSVAVAISIDQDRNTIYRFLDQRTGVLIRQVPPEEVLRVMRNIDEMLQASEQKVKVDA